MAGRGGDSGKWLLNGYWCCFSDNILEQDSVDYTTCECSKCHWIVLFKIVSFMLYVFNHNYKVGVICSYCQSQKVPCSQGLWNAQVMV